MNPAAGPPGRDRGPAVTGPQRPRRLKITDTVPPPPRVPQGSDLAPVGGRVYAVRWLREDRQVRQKLYRQGAAAEVFARKLHDAGYFPRIFVSRVDWRAAP